jgi:hypothetical protein
MKKLQNSNTSVNQNQKTKDFIEQLAEYPVGNSAIAKLAKLIKINVAEFVKIRDTYRSSHKERLSQVIFYERGMK